MTVKTSDIINMLQKEGLIKSVADIRQILDYTKVENNYVTMPYVIPDFKNEVVLARWNQYKLVDSVYCHKHSASSFHPDINSFMEFYKAKAPTVQEIEDKSRSEYHSLESLFPNTFVSDQTRDYVQKKFSEPGNDLGFFLDCSEIHTIYRGK